MSFTPGGNGGSFDVGQLSDAALNVPTQGQYFGYNSSLQLWQNQARPLPLLETVAVTSASGATRAIGDTSVATINYVTLTANCTFTFPTAGAGKSLMIVLKQDATGSRTATWPGTVKWPSGTAPTLTTTAAKTDVLSFVCIDGTNWLGFTAGKNY